MCGDYQNAAHEVIVTMNGPQSLWSGAVRVHVPVLVAVPLLYVCVPHERSTSSAPAWSASRPEKSMNSSLGRKSAMSLDPHRQQFASVSFKGWRQGLQRNVPSFSAMR